MSKWLKNSLSTLEPYHVELVNQGIKLDANESPYPILQELKNHMKEWVDRMCINRYPDTDSRKLIGTIAKAYKVDTSEVICGVGSDQLIDCILRGTLEKGDTVLTPYPSFSMYVLSTVMNGGINLKIPLTQDFQYDIEAMCEAIRINKPKVVFLCNPNNPTGSLLTLEEIETLLKLSSGLVIVDEAYMEYANQTAIPLIRQYDNLIVLRTFSKAYALAGARVGYGLANKEIIKMINIVKPPYNLNSFSEEIARWTLENRERFIPMIEESISEREALRLALCALGYKTYHSYANFLWVEATSSLDEILVRSDIYIRKMKYDDKLYYRITIGTSDENKALIQTLRQVIK